MALAVATQVQSLPLVSAAVQTTPPFAAGRLNELLVGELYGRWYQLAYNGFLFEAVTAPALLNTAGTTASVALYNPNNSGKNLVLVRAQMHITVIAGTPVAGLYGIYANTNPVAAPVTGTAFSPLNVFLGSANKPSASVLTTATLPAAPTLARVIGTKQVTTAQTFVQGVPPEIDFDGTFIIGPGCAISVQQSTADTTNATAAITLVWAELPV